VELKNTEEYIIVICASILKKYCDAGQQVGLIAQGESYYCFPIPVREGKHVAGTGIDG